MDIFYLCSQPLLAFRVSPLSLTGLLAAWLVTSQSHLGICSSCGLFFHCRDRYITLQSLCFIHSSSNIWLLEGQELCVLLFMSLLVLLQCTAWDWHCPDLQAVFSHQGKVYESVFSARFLWSFICGKNRALAVPEGLGEALCGWGESWRGPRCGRHFRPREPWGKSTGASNTAWEGHLPKLRVFLRKRQRKMRLGRKGIGFLCYTERSFSLCPA